MASKAPLKTSSLPTCSHVRHLTIVFCASSVLWRFFFFFFSFLYFLACLHSARLSRGVSFLPGGEFAPRKQVSIVVFLLFDF